MGGTCGKKLSSWPVFPLAGGPCAVESKWLDPDRPMKGSGQGQQWKCPEMQPALDLARAQLACAELTDMGSMNWTLAHHPYLSQLTSHLLQPTAESAKFRKSRTPRYTAPRLWKKILPRAKPSPRTDSPAPPGCGSNLCTQNGTLVNGTLVTTCGPIPGGLILTTHLDVWVLAEERQQQQPGEHRSECLSFAAQRCLTSCHDCVAARI